MSLGRSLSALIPGRMLKDSKGLLRFAQPFDVLKIREVENGFEQREELSNGG